MPEASFDSNCTQEVRFAVVMYGGVSLAIYINGVAQELLRMVRATAPDAKDGRPIPSSELNGSERVYREISQLLGEMLDPSRERNNDEPPTRFVIDTISGTSAGGINGVFLAKALANGQSLDELQRLWVREGAIEKLINDKGSNDAPLSAQEPPTALLNGQRMYFELLKAFDGMEEKTETSPLVTELDLFVTATDLRGITLPIRLADQVVYERRHRNVFHFVYSGGDDRRNDFVPQNNPFLAYASRCTSSFPFAFEPMTLCDTDSVLDLHGPYANDDGLSRSSSPNWKPFFRSYDQAKGLKTVPFPRRAFADGGDLDNRPFSYVIDTLAKRHAQVPVQRKLIYVEPSPEHPEDVIDIERRPNFIENVVAALSTLPRYETIREDLQRVVDRNRLIERLNRIMNGCEEDEAFARAQAGGSDVKLGMLDLPKDEAELWTKPELTDEEWAQLDLTDMIRRKGRSYIAYQRMEIAALTDELAKLITRVAGLDENSDYFIVVRSLVRAWRDKTYTSHRSDQDKRPTMNEYLHAFDLSYPLRRISFLQGKADLLHRLDSKALELLTRRRLVFWGKEGPSEDQKKEFRNELLRIKRGLKPKYDALRRLGRGLRSRYTPQQAGSSSPESSLCESPVYTQIHELIKQVNVNIPPPPAEVPAGRDQLLEYFLGKSEAKASASRSPKEEDYSHESVDELALRRATNLLNANSQTWDQFQLLAAELEKRLKGDDQNEAMEAIDEACLELLDCPAASAITPAAAACRCLRSYYSNYDDYDMITFPILYDTNVGEAAIVEVFRISPEDAQGLINERETKCRKLAGTALGHFGAFLERLWRQNDILWGRLDGAERLISALLPPDYCVEKKRALIGEAHASIVSETINCMGEKERHELLCESLMRTGSGESEPDLLTNFICALKSHAGEKAKAELDDKLKDEAVRQYYLDTYEERSRLKPQSSLEVAARATTVVGKMFGEVAAQYEVGEKSAAAIARLGQFFWALVEVSVPRSIPHLLFRYWLKLIYLFEVVLIAASTLILNPSVQKYGFLLFAITLAIHFAVWVLGNVITARKGWLPVLRSLGIVVVVVFLLLGIMGLLGMLGFNAPWKFMKRVHDWYAALQAGKKLWARIAVAAGFGLFFLWAIRSDLMTLWRTRRQSRNALKSLASEAIQAPMA